MQLAIVDNHDSFTFNLFQLAAETSGRRPFVVKNDDHWDTLCNLDFDAVIISPGPGRPDRPGDFGISRDAILRLDKPLLGVCLGHQGICYLAGGTVVHAPEPMHGRSSDVHHDGSELFAGITTPFSVVRYHSLVCGQPLPRCLRRTAWTESGIVMGLAHRSRPLWGVQFHPESICSEFGRAILENFLTSAERFLCDRSDTEKDERASDGRGRRASRRPAGPERRKVFVRRLPLHVEGTRLFEALYGRSSHAFWLDSSLVSTGSSRFSFMAGYGDHDVEVLRYHAQAQRLEVRRGEALELLHEDVFSYLKRRLAELEVECPELPFDFCCGYVGYLGYELKRLCGARAEHASPHPDCLLIFVDRCIAIDHLKGELYLLFLGRGREEGAAARWFDGVECDLRAAPPERAAPGAQEPGVAFLPAHSRESYLDKIKLCLAAIRDGESYEICLTNKLRATTSVEPWAFYEALRRQNPAPYAAFLRFPELSVACSSPERFLKISPDGRVETKPIKGTIKRGADELEDRLLQQFLAEDQKSRAENLMIVDLLRNDLGRICEIGSVSVPKLMAVETFATLHQLVSTVAGRLRPGRTAVDCLAAAFPGGSMTGAPKIRTMEIIDELEGEARGIYSGAIGFLSLNGAADLNIVIRAAVFSAQEVSIGIGGAIVAMSDPVEEWNETILKARALLSAFGVVEQALELCAP